MEDLNLENGQEYSNETASFEGNKKTRNTLSSKEKRLKITNKIKKYEDLLEKAKQELIDFDTREDLLIIKRLTPEQREYLENLKR